MRVKPIVGEVAWFGPRRAGWGWSPVTWQGWAVTVVVLLGVLGVTFARSGPALAASVALIPVFVVLAVVKGTSPGGPAAWRQFQRVRSGEVEAAEIEAETAAPSNTKRLLLAIGGLALAVILALLLLVAVVPSAIAPPTSVAVANGQLHVDLRGPYSLFALRGSISVPLSSVASARYDAKARDLPRGSRLGTSIPGGLIAGSFGHGATKAFWAVQHDGALVISINGESFSTLVVEVGDPTAVLRDLAAAGVRALR
ncbi:MAG: hypothetical protein V7636_1142 [Actinomycetota bacterium]